MNPLFMISVTLATIAACVWVQEQRHPVEIDHTRPFAFAFGMLVRLLLVVVIMVAVSIGMSTFWIAL